MRRTTPFVKQMVGLEHWFLNVHVCVCIYIFMCDGTVYIFHVFMCKGDCWNIQIYIKNKQVAHWNICSFKYFFHWSVSCVHTVFILPVFLKQCMCVGVAVWNFTKWNCFNVGIFWCTKWCVCWCLYSNWMVCVWAIFDTCKKILSCCAFFCLLFCFLRGRGGGGDILWLAELFKSFDIVICCGFCYAHFVVWIGMGIWVVFLKESKQQELRYPIVINY